VQRGSFSPARANGECGARPTRFILGIHRSSSTLLEANSRLAVSGRGHDGTCRYIRARVHKLQAATINPAPSHPVLLASLSADEFNKQFGEEIYCGHPGVRTGKRSVQRQAEHFGHLGFDSSEVRKPKIIAARRDPGMTGFSQNGQAAVSLGSGFTYGIADIATRLCTYIELMAALGKVRCLSHVLRVHTRTGRRTSKAVSVDSGFLCWTSACILARATRPRTSVRPQLRRLRPPIYQEGLRAIAAIFEPFVWAPYDRIGPALFKNRMRGAVSA